MTLAVQFQVLALASYHCGQQGQQQTAQVRYGKLFHRREFTFTKQKTLMTVTIYILNF